MIETRDIPRLDTAQQLSPRQRPRSASTRISPREHATRNVDTIHSHRQRPNSAPYPVGSSFAQAGKAAVAQHNDSLGSDVDSEYLGIRSCHPAKYDPTYYDTRHTDNLFHSTASEAVAPLYHTSEQNDVMRFESGGFMHSCRLGKSEGDSAIDARRLSVVSLNAPPSASLIRKLDAFIARHATTVVAYKMPISRHGEMPELWKQRNDPISIYVCDPRGFRDNCAQDELVALMHGFNREHNPRTVARARDLGRRLRESDAQLIGAYIAPGIRMAVYPDGHAIRTLLTKAFHIDPQLAVDVRRLAKAPGRSVHVSAGYYAAMTRVIDKLARARGMTT